MISSFFSHSCTPSAYFVFKEKKNKEIVLKVFDIMHNCVLTKSLQLEELKEIPFTLFPNKNLKEHVVWLIKNGYVPNPEVGNFQQLKPTQRDSSDLLVLLGSKIKTVFMTYRPKFILAQEYPKEYLCPITCSVMIEPVSDNDGHTFENQAILKALKIKNECPISRTPITSLTVNRNLKEAIEKFNQKAQVPMINPTVVEKPRLAESAIQNGLVYEEEGLLDEALESYIKALQYSKKIDHYLLIPKLLEKMNQPAAAALCYLHLADYYCQQTEQVDQDKILKLLEKANALYPDFPPILRLMAYYFYELRQPEKEELISQRIREIYWNNKSEEAYSFYKEQIEKNPNSLLDYERLISTCPNSMTQAHFYLKGALHFLTVEKYDHANDFFSQCYSIAKEGPLTLHLPYLNFLKSQKKTKELEEICLELAKLFENKNSIKEMIFCYQVLLSITKEDIYYSKIVSGYQILNKKEKSLRWSSNWFDYLLYGKKYEKSEQVILSALKIDNENIEFYKLLEELYNFWEKPKLCDLLLRMGKMHETRGNLIEATSKYQSGYARFKESQHLFALVNILLKSENKEKVVTLCYKAAREFLYKNQIDFYHQCVNQILAIDPDFELLQENKKNALKFYIGLNRKITDLTPQVNENESQEVIHEIPIVTKNLDVSTQNTSTDQKVTDENIEIPILNLKEVEEKRISELEKMIADLKNKVDEQAIIIDNLSKQSLGTSIGNQSTKETNKSCMVEDVVLVKEDFSKLNSKTINERRLLIKRINEKSTTFQNENLNSIDEIKEYFGTFWNELECFSLVKKINTKETTIQDLKLGSIDQIKNYFGPLCNEIKCYSLEKLEDLEKIKQVLPNLQYLSITHAGVLEKDFLVHLQGLKLKELEFNSCDLDSDLNDVSKNLDNVNLYINDDSLHYLADMSLSTIYFNRCNFTYDALAPLKKMPLISVYFHSCLNMKDETLAQLRGIQLTSISCNNCPNLTDATFAHFQGMSLTSIDFSNCPNLTDKAFVNLVGMQLKKVNFSNCYKLTDNAIAHLKGMPLISINFGMSIKFHSHSNLTGEALIHLIGMPLKSINFSNCIGLKDNDLAHLQGMWLTNVNFSGCTNLTEKALVHFKGMPLTCMNLSYCNLGDNPLVHLKGMPLIDINFNFACLNLTDNDFIHLKGMPLISIQFAGSKLLTDKCLENLKAMLLTRINFSHCNMTENVLDCLKLNNLKSIKFYPCNFTLKGRYRSLTQRLKYFSDKYENSSIKKDDDKYFNHKMNRGYSFFMNDLIPECTMETDSGVLHNIRTFDLIDECRKKTTTGTKKEVISESVALKKSNSKIDLIKEMNDKKTSYCGLKINSIDALSDYFGSLCKEITCCSLELKLSYDDNSRYEELKKIKYVFPNLQYLTIKSGGIGTLSVKDLILLRGFKFKELIFSQIPNFFGRPGDAEETNKIITERYLLLESNESNQLNNSFALGNIANKKSDLELIYQFNQNPDKPIGHEFSNAELLNLLRKEGSKLNCLNLLDREIDLKQLLVLIGCCPNLQELVLDGHVLTSDETLSYLANAPTLSSLKSLKLRYCDKITDAGLAHLKYLFSLESLKLAYCDKITDTCLIYLKAISSLQLLHLVRCHKITDAGLVSLAAFSSLQSLYLYECCGITKAGIAHLAAHSSLRINTTTQ